MVATSSNEVIVAPKMVGTSLKNAAKGSGMSGGKRSASVSPPKPRISSNLDGRRSGLSRKVRNEPDVVAGADQPPTLGKKTQSVSKAANEASEPANAPDGMSGRGGKIPKSPVGRSGKMRALSPVRTRSQPAGHSNVTVLSSSRRANSDESVNLYSSGRDASKKCIEARGAQDSICFNANDDEGKDEEDDEADEIEDDTDEVEDAELCNNDMLQHRKWAEASATRG
jgi:hypothetical protein